jgi:hypothetical protein
MVQHASLFRWSICQRALVSPEELTRSHCLKILEMRVRVRLATLMPTSSRRARRREAFLRSVLSRIAQAQSAEPGRHVAHNARPPRHVGSALTTCSLRRLGASRPAERG